MEIKVSVIMSAYNAEQFIAQAVDSILAQSFGDFELIIINDGSADRTKSIIEQYVQQDSRIVLLDQENTGLTKALNNGIKIARGNYIARMDADDIAEPDRLERQYQFMEKNSEYALCGSRAWFIDENNKKLFKKELPITNDSIKKKLLFNNQFVHSSLFIRKSILDEMGFYNEDFKKSQDYELVLRFASKYQIANLEDCLVLWRVNSKSISWSSKNQEKDAIRARWLAVRKYNYSFVKGVANIVLRLAWMIVPQSIKMKRHVK